VGAARHDDGVSSICTHCDVAFSLAAFDDAAIHGPNSMNGR
jgi:hypothetical protein